MCDISVHTRTYDPTRTTVLRNRAVNESNRRFNSLISLIRKSVYTNNAFGLEVNAEAPYGAFAFPLDMLKLEAFMEWLQQQIDAELFSIIEQQQVGESVVSIWTNKYIVEAYRRGVDRARKEMKKAGFNVPSIAAVGGMGTVMTIPLHLETVGLLFLRAFNELKGITDQMAHQISRVLAQGLIDGTNSAILTKRLVAAINGKGVGDLGLTDTLGRFIPAKRRAEIMVRTEIIRAHHYATVNEYRNWGLEGVRIMAEFKTVGDDRVCPICASMEGNWYTLDEVLPLIPVHPQCRCIALPIPVDENGKRETTRE